MPPKMSLNTPPKMSLLYEQFARIIYFRTVYIVSWGNFGHGATSVKNSLRNHFGRINNV